MSFCTGFIDHYFKNAKDPPLLLWGKSQQLLGDKAAFPSGGDIEDIRQKQVRVTLERVGDGNKGV